MCALIVATISANNIIGQTGNGVGLGDVEWGRVVESGLVGAVSGFAAGGVGHWAANSSMFINGLSNPLARTLAVAPLASGAGHIAGGTASGLFEGQSINQAFHDSFNGIGKSMLISTGIGVASTIGVSYANGINPVTGRAIAVKGSSQLVKYSGILRDAAKHKGDFGLGRGTKSEALELGKAWVGDGHTVSKNGRFWISKDGLRQFQIPNYKPQLGKYQSNFYWKNIGQKQWQANGHLDIIR